VPQEFYLEDWHDPAAMQAHARDAVTDEEFLASAIVSSDPAEHVKRIREIEELGASVVVLMNISGADPHAAFRVYNENVLPELQA
jgi:coenzyme F420-dependent glucose-6-phosphate dehydrogenase